MLRHGDILVMMSAKRRAYVILVLRKALFSFCQARSSGALGVKVNGEVSTDFGVVMERMRRLRADISKVDSAKRFSEDLGVDVFQVIFYARQERYLIFRYYQAIATQGDAGKEKSLVDWDSICGA